MASFQLPDVSFIHFAHHSSFNPGKTGRSANHTTPGFANAGSSGSGGSGSTWGGVAGMLDWGSNDWRQTNIPDPNHPGYFIYNWTDPTMKGGPGSFEQALEYAMLTAWQNQASPPNICKLITQNNANGNVNPTAGGAQLVTAVRQYLMAQAGALIPAMVAAWNASHTTGTISTEVECTQALCQQAGGIWFGGGDCGSGGVTVQCNTTAPAPQRKISYTVSGPTQSYVIDNDPLQLAFDGLAALAGIPAGATISVMVNSGPSFNPNLPHLAHPVGVVFKGASNTPTTSLAPQGAAATGMSTTSKWLLGLGIAAGVGALALEIYARKHHMTFGQATQHLWTETKSKFHRTPRLRSTSRTLPRQRTR